MKDDTQHLDFLISQYVDGTLDGANRRLIEQQLANEPAARGLLKEHQDVQELLDDWGSRIPLIDWNQFDQELAARLAQEEVAVQRAAAWRRWMRPVAAAAALAMAALVGYSWHNWSRPTTVVDMNVAEAAPVKPVQEVRIVEAPAAKPMFIHIEIPESNAASQTVATVESPSWLNRPAIAVQIDGTTAEGPRSAVNLPTRGGPITGSAQAEAIGAQPPVTQPAPEVLHY